MAIDNVALVRRFVDQVWNKGNMNEIDQLASPAIKTHDPLAGDLEGLEAQRQYVRQFRTAFPDFNVTIDDIGAVGDKVFVRWTATGTHKGMLSGISPTNKRGVSQGITINRFDSGKLVETWYAWDVYRLVSQLGLAPSLDTLARGQAQPRAHA